MSHPAASRPVLCKQGPKRFRKTRRDYGEGQYSQYPASYRLPRYERRQARSPKAGEWA